MIFFENIKKINNILKKKDSNIFFIYKNKINNLININLLIKKYIKKTFPKNKFIKFKINEKTKNIIDKIYNIPFKKYITIEINIENDENDEKIKKIIINIIKKLKKKNIYIIKKFIK